MVLRSQCQMLGRHLTSSRGLGWREKAISQLRFATNTVDFCGEFRAAVTEPLGDSGEVVPGVQFADSECVAECVWICALQLSRFGADSPYRRGESAAGEVTATIGQKQGGAAARRPDGQPALQRCNCIAVPVDIPLPPSLPCHAYRCRPTAVLAPLFQLADIHPDQFPGAAAGGPERVDNGSVTRRFGGVEQQPVIGFADGSGRGRRRGQRADGAGRIVAGCAVALQSGVHGSQCAEVAVGGDDGHSVRQCSFSPLPDILSRNGRYFHVPGAGGQRNNRRPHPANGVWRYVDDAVAVWRGQRCGLR